MDDCPICCDSYTIQLRKEVKCQYCNFSACTLCQKKYITEGLLDAHCMSCRRAWNDDFLDMNFTKAFRTGPYRKFREDVLLEREISLLPTRQVRVEAKVKLREENKKLREINKKLQAIELERQEIMRESNKIQRSATRYEAESLGVAPPAWTLVDGEGKEEKERAKFIMKCPDGECRGFLSSAYKCGTCQIWFCPDCLVNKGDSKDNDHTCDEGTKATVALIVKESKPCPKCGERIGKIDGCNQMWCTECHTAFDWVSGQKVNGVIHNPHYYEYLRSQGNGVAPQVDENAPCGGVPYFNALRNCIRRLSENTQRIIMGIHRITAEINDYRIGGYQGNFDHQDNGDLGVLYLMKDINKEDMKKELGKREVKRAKQQAIRAVLEMFVYTSTMMLNRICTFPPTSEKEFEPILKEFLALKKYVNDSLLNVSKMKVCSVPQIGKNDDDQNWTWLPFNKAAPAGKKNTKVAEKEKEKEKEKEEKKDTSSDDSTDEEEDKKEKSILEKVASTLGFTK